MASQINNYIGKQMNLSTLELEQLDKNWKVYEIAVDALYEGVLLEGSDTKHVLAHKDTINQYPNFHSIITINDVGYNEVFYQGRIYTIAA